MKKTVINQNITEDWALYHGDCVDVMGGIKNNSIDFSIFSPPFSQLYIYSDDIRDMGNCSDDSEFFQGFKFFVDRLYEIMRPGRIVAVHCKQLVNFKNSSGKTGIRDFRGDIIRTFLNSDLTSLINAKRILQNKNLDTKHIDIAIKDNQKYSESGWSFHSEITIWKDPVTEMYRTNTQRLLRMQLNKDSSLSGAGLAEYILLFRKWCPEQSEDEIPINWKNNDNFPLEQWQKWASPVWMDIKQTNVLNSRMARDNKDEKHICPLQLDLIERAVLMWSNPGEIVFDPFAGVCSSGVMAIKNDRKFMGIELKESYYNAGLKFLNESISNLNRKEKQLSLF